MPDSPRMREGWSSFVLILLLMLIMAWAYGAGGLAEGLRILPAIVALGACLGLACARLRLPGSLVHPLGLLAGIVCCFLLLSSTIVLPTVVHLAAAQKDPSWWYLLLAKGQYMQAHLQEWLVVAAHGQASADPFPFVVQMAALQWLIAFYSAWFLFRLHWVWGAIVPGGLATFFGVYYAPPRLMIYFAAFVLVALILLVLVNVYQHQEDWRRHHVVYDRQIGIEFLRDGAVLAVVVMSLVWLVPRLPTPGRASSLLDQWQDPWRKVQQEWNRLYAALSYREASGLTSFGRTVTLGGAINLSRAPIMEVQASEGRYWRAVVLDRYTGSGWADTNPTSLRLAANVPFMDRSTFQSREVLTQTMQLAKSSETVLFAAGEPLMAQIATRVQVAPHMAGAGLDVSTIYLAQTLGRENRYLVYSYVSSADIRSLRQAGTSYSTDILGRYLQLPETLPARIGELAREIAGTQPTPYDQAVAIENYLRQIKYNLSIPTPPGGRDPTDWFLFENREGYCTYYASAMVLMCRTLGIPARFAQGYARGEWVPEHNAFLVRESDAHAWPEVYFPGYGWIEFEPTPSQPMILRPLGEIDVSGSITPRSTAQPRGRDPLEDMEVPAPSVNVGNLGAPLRGFRPTPWFWALLAVLVAGLGALGIALWRARRRWRNLLPSERLYLRLTWAARPLGVRLSPSQTPSEFGRHMDDALSGPTPLASPLVQMYVRERYGGRSPDAGELRTADALWRRLVPATLRRSLKRMVKRRKRQRQLDAHQEYLAP